MCVYGNMFVNNWITNIIVDDRVPFPLKNSPQIWDIFANDTSKFKYYFNFIKVLTSQWFGMVLIMKMSKNHWDLLNNMVNHDSTRKNETKKKTMRKKNECHMQILEQFWLSSCTFYDDCLYPLNGEHLMVYSLAWYRNTHCKCIWSYMVCLLVQLLINLENYEWGPLRKLLANQQFEKLVQKP